MITGDTIETARAIGREIDLLDSPDALALTSTEFNALSAEELQAKVPHIRILARALPKDKYKLVGLLQDERHVVAMTGDGTNDAPALKRADVGLAMGISGTEVAKEASKIVLLDDSFNTIVRAVQWGRALLRKHPALHPVPAHHQRLGPHHRFPGTVPGPEAALHGPAITLDQRHHGYVRRDRVVQRAAARQPHAQAAETA